MAGMKTLFAAALLIPLTACAIIPDTPMSSGEAAAQGMAVAIAQPVWAGDAILTPLAVKEDSRCPVNARCVWAGKLTVSTRIAATHWTQTAPLTLGEPYEVMGRTYVLVSATPEQTTDGQIAPGDYRFIFERR
tara:strand:- start:883 stop:1281 length:399 start_codon:yes stop_codon:yes gene_type:complete